MAGRLEKEKIIAQAEIESALQSIANIAKKVTDEFDRIAVSGSNIGKSITDTKSLKEIINLSKEQAKNEKLLADQQKSMIDVQIKVQQQLEREAKAREALAKALIAEEKLKQSLLKTEKQQTASKDKLIKSTEELTFEQQNLANQAQNLGKITAQLENANSSYAKSIIKTKLELADSNKWQKLKIQQNNSEAGSYDQLDAKYQRITMMLNKMSTEYRENNNRGKELTKTANNLYTELSKLDESTGKHQRSVGQYSKAFNGLQFQVTQLARELPALAYGPQMFIAAISNNFPMLQDEIARTRVENEKLRAEGQKGISIWKQMAGAIFSWQTAIVVGITAYMMFSKQINAWIGSMFGGISATEKAKIAQERLNEANKKGFENGQQDLVHMKLLYNATQDQTRSVKERLSAVNELQRIYPDYFDNMTDEEVMAGKASKAYYQLANAIMASAKAKAYEGIIVENEVKSRDLELEVIKKREELITAAEKLKKEQAMFDNMSVEGQQAYAAKLLISENTVKGLVKDINDLNTEISAIQYSSRELAGQINPTDLLSDIGGSKAKSSGKSTPLEEMQSLHKRELEEVEKYQNELLANEELTDSQILQGKADNSRELIRIRLDQIDEEKKIKNLSDKELSALNLEYSQKESELAKITSNFVISEDKRLTKEQIEEAKRRAKQLKEEQEQLTKETIANNLEIADNEKLSAQETAMDKIRAAQGNKDKIEAIQHELSLFFIDEDIAAQQRILDTKNLEVQAYEDASKRIRQLRLARGEEEISYTDYIEQKKSDVRKETIQGINSVLQEGLSFAQMIYSAQADRAKSAYDSELEAAGDSVEGQIIAKRKYEEEDRKIRKRQAIASKLQAVFDAGVNLAMAIATTWKNPFIAALNIAAASTGLAMAIAQPLPAFSVGTDNAPSEFIAGEEGSELITLQTGEQLLTPNKPTHFKGNEFVGAKITPHDETMRYLANYAVNQTYDILDLSITNNTLKSIDNSLKNGNQEQRSYDSKGRLTVKRNNITTHYTA